MIKKLKWKFVLINMIFVTAVIITVFVVMFISTQQNLQRDSINNLHRVMAESDKPKWSADNNNQNVKLPYFTITVDSEGNLIDTGGYYLIDNIDIINDVISQSMKNTSDIGTIEEYSIRYLIQSTPTGFEIACVDLSSENRILSNLVINSILIGFVSLSVFFAISVFLSMWALKPVEKAWTQQKRFVADASHELNTPLTVILANMRLLLTHKKDTIESQEKWIDYAKIEALRMKKLIEDLLYLAKTDNLETKREFTRLDLSEIVLQYMLIFEPLVYEQNKKLKYDLSENILVKGDENYLKQLLIILLDNACKFAPKSSTINVSLKAVSDKKVLLAIHNEGEPISKDALPHLFDRFFRADEARKESGGYGLGLSIAKNIVEQHNGKITAESGEKGTEIFVSLPYMH